MKRLSALFFLLVLAAPALAEEAAPNLRPVYEPDGSFGFCLAEQTYPDGRKITFALSPKNEINIGTTIPKAGFRKDAHYDITLRLDNESGRAIRSRALNEETLLLQMGGSEPFRQQLSQTKSLSVGAGQTTVAFALPLMDKLLGTLNLCLAENQGKSFQEAASAPADEPSVPQAEDESFPPFLQNLLARARLLPVTPLSLEGIAPEKRPADFLWRKDKILGGLREMDAPKGQRLETLIGLHLQGLKRKCEGKFGAALDRERRADGIVLRVAEAGCEPREKGGKDITVGLVFFLSKTGRWSVLTHEGFGEDKAQIFAARDAVAKALLESEK